MPVIEETITTEPPPDVRKCGSPARMSSAACPAFSVKVAVKSPGPESARFPPTVPPALATRWSRPPSADAMSMTARPSMAASLTSAAAVLTDPPWRPSWRAGASREPAAVPADDADRGSLGGERVGDGEADAPASSGDERAGPAQTEIHASTLPRAQRHSPACTAALMTLPSGASGHCHWSLYRHDGW